MFFKNISFACFYHICECMPLKEKNSKLIARLLILVKVLISSLSSLLIKIHVDIGSQQVIHFIALMNTG